MFSAFYSDPHFGHANIIKFCDRPFSSVTDMNRGLVERYNSRITRKDRVLWLGDCFFGSSAEFSKIMGKLNGEKWLVLGNHDKSPSRMVELGFSIAAPELRFQLENIHFRAVHFPYRTLSQDTRFQEKMPIREKDVVLLHGHTHSPNKTLGAAAVHVGVDAWDYYPAPVREVVALAKTV